MTKEELRKEISIELNSMEIVVGEIDKFVNNPLNKDRVESIVKAGIAAYVMQYYNGVENILKRISKYYNIAIPKSEFWHLELFDKFCEPLQEPLPLLFNKEFEEILIDYRRFRHYVVHGYSFRIDWTLLREGVSNITQVFDQFKTELATFLQSL